MLPITLAVGQIEQTGGLRLIEYLISYITATEVKRKVNASLAATPSDRIINEIIHE